MQNTRINISNIQDCYGCGVCTTICAQKIIEIRLNSNGFYEPFIIDESKCTYCGLCINVCAYCNEGLSVNNILIKSYAAWSNEPIVRRKCSSGGIGFEIGRYLIGQGYKVCGVRYNVNNNRAEHYIANNVEELIPSIGSKYIQSYTVDGFKAINRKEKYLVTGTPCQIDSFRRYIRKFNKEDNFILMDFFCHGVPSMHLWNKYIKWAETKVGKLTYISWRNKFTGWHNPLSISIDQVKTTEPVDWHDSYNMLIKGEKGLINSRLGTGDMFYRLFLSDTCLNKACYNKCKYKYTHSSADIRIGDLWGIKYRKDRNGVNGVLTFTEKGEKLLHTIPHLHIEFCDFKYVTEGQMKSSPPLPNIRNKVFNMLEDRNVTLQEIVKFTQIYCRKKKIKKLLTNPLSILKYKFIQYFNL